MWKQLLIRNSIFPPPPKWRMCILALLFMSDSSILVAAWACLWSFCWEPQGYHHLLFPHFTLVQLYVVYEASRIGCACCGTFASGRRHLLCFLLEPALLTSVLDRCFYFKAEREHQKIGGIFKLWKSISKLRQPEVKNKCPSQQLSNRFRQSTCQFTVTSRH